MTDTENKPIRVLLADDHEIIRDGLRLMISKQPGLELVAAAANGDELVEQALVLGPDIILTDIKMPKLDGIEATKLLHHQLPSAGIIALTLYDEDYLILQMLEAGARGYIVKNARKNEIFEAIQSVHNKKTYYCHQTSERLARMIVESQAREKEKKEQPSFTDRELQVINLICREYSSKEMAAEMFLSIRTIEGYREKIQEKMNARNMAGIVVQAIKLGLYDPHNEKG